MSAYFLGKDTNEPITGAGGLSEVGGNPCMADCRNERRLCYQENQGRGESTDICDRHFNVCQQKCGGTSPHPGNCYEGQECSDVSDCAGKPCVVDSKGIKRCQCTPPPAGPCVQDKVCTKQAECGDGYCRNGKCQCAGCQDDAYCTNKYGAGWKCVKEAGSSHGLCRNLAACVEGRKCNGPTDCGGKPCVKEQGAYAKDPHYMGKCHCKGGGDGGGGGLGEYKYPSDLYKNTPGEYGYPDEMQELMSLLLGRGKELLGMPTGYTQEAIEKMYGRDFEKIRGQEAGQRETLMNTLARSGMTGTGAGNQMLNQLAWGTEGNISDLARDLFIANEEKKKQDLLDYTNAAQGIMGGGALSYESLLEDINKGRRGETFNIEQLQEAINAARRGESSQALMLLIQFLGLLGG